jgi:transposase-like protein
MISLPCQHEKLKKHGKDCKGQQRLKCIGCGTSVSGNNDRPLGEMRLDMKDSLEVLCMLLEGMSIRACPVARSACCSGQPAALCATW